MYEYYVSAISDSVYIGRVLKLDYKVNSAENIAKLYKEMRTGNNKELVILFFKQLNE